MGDIIPAQGWTASLSTDVAANHFTASGWAKYTTPTMEVDGVHIWQLFWHGEAFRLVSDALSMRVLDACRRSNFMCWCSGHLQLSNFLPIYMGTRILMLDSINVWHCGRPPLANQVPIEVAQTLWQTRMRHCVRLALKSANVFSPTRAHPAQLYSNAASPNCTTGRRRRRRRRRRPVVTMGWILHRVTTFESHAV